MARAFASVSCLYGEALAVLLFAALLGWLGAQLSVGRHLSAIEPR